MASKLKVHTCPACKGTGCPVMVQPGQPGRNIDHPVKCKACGGKGNITDADRGGSWPSDTPVMIPLHAWSSGAADQFGHGALERGGDRKGRRYR